MYYRTGTFSITIGIFALYCEQVLWPECSWQPVSLTDMITSTLVKMFYRKANLCVHPDKVQQKDATLQQKYTAGKVFDILKVHISLSLCFLYTHGIYLI